MAPPQSKIQINEGYFKAWEDDSSDLPSPVKSDRHMSTDFMKKLYMIESHIESSKSSLVYIRQDSLPCLFCPPESHLQNTYVFIYEDDTYEVQWNRRLMHYIQFHKVHPSKAFQQFVDNIFENIYM